MPGETRLQLLTETTFRRGLHGIVNNREIDVIRPDTLNHY